jgi:predicted hydrolase (HD superfamily)
MARWSAAVSEGVAVRDHESETSGAAVDRARETAMRQLATALPIRWRHSQQVAATAETWAERVGGGAACVASAWLHDIGYSASLADTGFHPLDGARHLRRQGWPEDIVCLVAHHSCADVEADARGLGDVLRAEFPDTPSIGRDILWAADATTGPSGACVTVEERVAEVLTRYGPDHLVSRCMVQIRPALQGAHDRVMAELRARA